MGICTSCHDAPRTGQDFQNLNVADLVDSEGSDLDSEDLPSHRWPFGQSRSPSTDDEDVESPGKRATRQSTVEAQWRKEAEAEAVAEADAERALVEAAINDHWKQAMEADDEIAAHDTNIASENAESSPGDSVETETARSREASTSSREALEPSRPESDVSGLVASSERGNSSPARSQTPSRISREVQEAEKDLLEIKNRILQESVQRVGRSRPNSASSTLRISVEVVDVEAEEKISSNQVKVAASTKPEGDREDSIMLATKMLEEDEDV